MNQYLLSTYAVAGEVPGAPHTPEEMQAFMERLLVLEADMDESDVFVFGGALLPPDAATVVDIADGEAVETGGTFIESEKNLAGFYIINAAGLDEALAWAGKVATATNHPIEVRPFQATGRVADHM